jgi:hypothetical protein
MRFAPRQLVPGLSLLALAVSVVWLRPTDDAQTPKRDLTVYDSALLTLREFVAAGDDKLGFADVKEFNGAHVDLQQGVQVNFLRNDTARSSFNWYDTLLMDLGRVVYPVYAKVQGHDVLRSSITFDSLGGVHPVMFDDSTLILASVKHRRETHNEQTRYGMIMVPTLGITANVVHTATGDSVLETEELHRALGRHWRQGMCTNDLLHAVRSRLQSR